VGLVLVVKRSGDQAGLLVRSCLAQHLLCPAGRRGVGRAVGRDGRAGGSAGVQACMRAGWSDAGL
jgi:hypothetical protein